MPEYKFETLQLHVGQETPDPATDARAVPPFMRRPHMSFTTVPTRRPVLAYRTQATFTAD